MSEKMRATMHNGRSGKDGTFTAKHNDRDFDTSKAKHIKKNMSQKNWTWQRYQKTNPDLTFDEAERKFYEEYIGQSLEAQNERHRQSRHFKRVRTIDEYRTAKQTCPEETILQIGKKGDTISAQLLHKIALEQINWEIKTFPNVKILDAAMHVDEQGAPHMHKRQVWIANGKDGLTVSQNDALKEMGIERPDTSKKETRWNNAKMTYTEQCRQHFLDTCKKYGIDIEVEPKEASESGLSLLEYQRRQEQEKLEKAKDEQKAIEAEKRRQLSRKKTLNERKASLDKQEEKYKENMQQLSRQKKEYNTRVTSLNDRIRDFNAERGEFAEEKEKIIRMANRALKQQKENEAKEAELNKRQAELDKREKSFTNSQKKTIEEIKGMASYVGSMTEEQLERTRKKMKKVEDAEDFEEIINAMQSQSALTV